MGSLRQAVRAHEVTLAFGVVQLCRRVLVTQRIGPAKRLGIRRLRPGAGQGRGLRRLCGVVESFLRGIRHGGVSGAGAVRSLDRAGQCRQNLRQTGGLLGQPLDGGRRVRLRANRRVQVRLKFQQPDFGGSFLPSGTVGFLGQAFGLDAAALQAACGLGSRLPRDGQCGFGFGQRGGGRGGFFGRIGGGLRGLDTACLRRRFLRARGGQPDGQVLRLRAPDQAGDVAVTRCLAGLLAHRLLGSVELRAQILGARQVGLGGAQLQLGLVAAGVQAGDAGGLLEHLAALLRPRVHQGGDAALADHAAGARAAGQVRVERLHVAGAVLAAVDAERGAGAALDAAGDLQFGLGLERCGQRAVQGDGDLG